MKHVSIVPSQSATQVAPNTLEIQTENVKVRASGETANIFAFGFAIGFGYVLGKSLFPNKRVEPTECTC